MATIRTDHPMGAARFVRRERYVWPGGYALALVTTDGATLCPDCVASEFPQIARAHRARDNDGWWPAGIACAADSDEECICEHCWRVIWPAMDESKY